MDVSKISIGHAPPYDINVIVEIPQGGAHFFQHYKDLERGKWVNIVRWVGPDGAAELIAAAIARAPG